jgi:toxin ParE1/3/4
LPTLVFRPRAEADLLDIWLSVAVDDPAAADRLIDRIREQCVLISEYPELGPTRPLIAPDARIWPVGRYLLLYKPILDGAEIQRVVHGARDIANL